VPLSRATGESTGAAEATGTMAHESMSESAHYLKNRLGPIVRDIFSKESPLKFLAPVLGESVLSSFEVVVTGHSVGAGTASLLAVLLKEELGISKVRAYGFATPPVMDKISSLASKSYVTSVVNNADVVPRASVRNLAVLADTMKWCSKIIKSGGASAAYDDAREAQAKVIEEREEALTDLYVPGKVVYMYKDGSSVYRAAVVDGTSPILGAIQPVQSMMTDHQGAMYVDAVAALSPSEPVIEEALSPVVVPDAGVAVVPNPEADTVALSESLPAIQSPEPSSS